MNFSKGIRRAFLGLLVTIAISGINGQNLHGQETLPALDSSDLTELSRVPTVVAQFTTGVENREPIDQVTFVENRAQKIFFFSDLRGLTGQTVQHRWIYNGETKAEINFDVRGPRWRVWSSKDLMPDWIGDWTVEIVVVGGEVIAAETFTYSAPDA